MENHIRETGSIRRYSLDGLYFIMECCRTCRLVASRSLTRDIAHKALDCGLHWSICVATRNNL